MQNYRNNAMAYNNYRQTPACAAPQTVKDGLEGMPLAMAYVPWQKWQSVYDAEKALHYGTIFQELYKPFLGKGGCRS